MPSAIQSGFSVKEQYGRAKSMVVSQRILVIDDNESLATALAELLERRGFPAEAVFDAETALSRLSRGDIDLLVLDVDLGDADGADLLRSVRRQGISTPVVLITARDAARVRSELNVSRVDVVEKPFAPPDLVRLISTMLQPPAGLLPAGSGAQTRLLTFTMEARLKLDSPQQQRLPDKSGVSSSDQ